MKHHPSVRCSHPYGNVECCPVKDLLQYIASTGPGVYWGMACLDVLSECRTGVIRACPTDFKGARSALLFASESHVSHKAELQDLGRALERGANYLLFPNFTAPS